MFVSRFSFVTLRWIDESLVHMPMACTRRLAYTHTHTQATAWYDEKKNVPVVGRSISARASLLKRVSMHPVYKYIYSSCNSAASPESMDIHRAYIRTKAILCCLFNALVRVAAFLCECVCKCLMCCLWYWAIATIIYPVYNIYIYYIVLWLWWRVLVDRVIWRTCINM